MRSLGGLSACAACIPSCIACEAQDPSCSKPFADMIHPVCACEAAQTCTTIDSKHRRYVYMLSAHQI